MATITFHAGEGFTISELNGSGLGFFGTSGFGASVPVGEYQGTTFITDGNGITQGPQADNVKYLNAGSGILNAGASGIGLKRIPNYQSTLNIRFTHGTAVKTQNAELRIYDRTSINNPPSGVVCKVAEIIHPSNLQTVTGSGDSQWITPAGSAVVVDMVDSPGMSGQRPNGANTTSTRHDWFAILSAMPDSIGSKNKFGLYFACEYL